MLFRPFVNFPLFMPLQATSPADYIMSLQRFLYVISITIVVSRTKCKNFGN